MTRPRAVPIGLAALLAALSILSPFSIDTFFPAFRAMQAEFRIDALTIQQTLTAYLLPYALMSLVHGPLSDAFGRRPVVLWGLALYALASLACAFAPGFAALLAFRALQGITAGAGMTVGRAVVRDLYDGPEAQRLMNAVTMFFSIAPALAPVLGGILFVAFGWRSVFVLLTVLGVAVGLACLWLLPETHPPARRVAFDVRSLAMTAWGIARHREFLMLAVAGGVNFAAVLMYVGSAPAIVLDRWGLSETQFAALFVPIIGGFLFGAIISSRMAGRIAPARQALLGFVLSLLGSAATVSLNLLVTQAPLLLQQVLLTITTLGVQFVVPVLTVRMLDLFPDVRGSAASVQSFAALLFSCAAIGVLAPLLQGSLVALGVASMLAALTSLALWWSVRSPAQVVVTVPGT